MKKKVADIILEFLKQDEGNWHAGYEFVNRQVGIGNTTYFLGSSSDRKARELAEKGVIERKHEKGYAWYRIKPKLQTVNQQQLKSAIHSVEQKRLNFIST